MYQNSDGTWYVEDEDETVVLRNATKSEAEAVVTKGNDKMKQRVAEAYHPMGKKASYNDVIPQVKIILQHSRQIEEGEQRYRNVAKIFLENQEGERFLAPTTRPGIAQIYARHIAEGGLPNDERWNHIKALCEEYSQMAGFVRATRNKQFNESAQALVNEGINHYQSLRETLGKLRGHRGYNQYFESWTPALMENEDVDLTVNMSQMNKWKVDQDNVKYYDHIMKNKGKIVTLDTKPYKEYLNKFGIFYTAKLEEDTDINELFVQETVDPRIESVMPILSRLYKKTGETPVKEVKELEQWADSIVEGEETLEEGSDASPVVRAIINRILVNRRDLIQQHGADKVLDAINDVADLVGEVDEIGTSDVSGWIRQVEGILGHEEIDESYIVKKLKDPDIYAVFNKYQDKSRYFLTSKGTKEEAEAFLAKLKAQHKDGDWRKAKTTHTMERTSRQVEDILGHKEIDEDVNDSSEMKTWLVWIKNNYYNGKYPDYSARPYTVVASSKEEARKVVLDNADEVLKDLLSKRFHSTGRGIGRRILPPKSALPITADRIGHIEDGTVKVKLTTAKPKMFFTPTGKQELMIDDGFVVGTETNEGLDKSQKKAGQLGPTEKVGPKGAVGKLVGVCENVNESHELTKVDTRAKQVAERMFINGELNAEDMNYNEMVGELSYRLETKLGMSKYDAERNAKGILSTHKLDDDILEDIKRLIK